MALSHFVPASPSPSLCPQVHSLCLHLYSCPAPRLFRTIFFRLALGILKPGSTNCSQEIGELSEYVCKILWVEDPEFWSKSQRQPWPTLKYPNSFIRNTRAQLYMWPPAIIWCSPHIDLFSISWPLCSSIHSCLWQWWSFCLWCLFFILGFVWWTSILPSRFYSRATFSGEILLPLSGTKCYSLIFLPPL